MQGPGKKEYHYTKVILGTIYENDSADRYLLLLTGDRLAPLPKKFSLNGTHIQ